MTPWLLISAALALDPIDDQTMLQLEAQRIPPQSLAGYINHDDPETRARAARSLGRLRTATALSPLRRLVADDDPRVRYEAAFALGQTPGGEPALLTQLTVETDLMVRAVLVEGLGKVGAERSISPLIAALDERPVMLQSPEVAVAAGHALGIMARREVEGIKGPEVISALLSQLDRGDPEVRRSAAYALSRIRPESLSDADTDRLLVALARIRDPDTRTRLIYATMNLDLPDRDARYAPLLSDPDPGVRVALARTAEPAGWMGVASLLDAPELGVRREAISAIAGMEGFDHAALLLPLLEVGSTLEAAEANRVSGDPAVVEAAEVLSALASSEVEGVSDLIGEVSGWLDSSRPTRIRVAAAAISEDTAILQALAIGDDETAVRTMAAWHLAELEPGASVMIALLSSLDPMVIAVGADWLSENPVASAEGALLAALEDATDIDLLKEVADALLALYSGSYPKVRRPALGASDAIKALSLHHEIAIRAVAVELAAATRTRLPPSHPPIRSVPLVEVQTIRMAQVQTTRGTFTVELYPEEAPLTVWNFARLAEDGFYDNLIVHRVVPDFVVQDGDPRGDGAGGPGWTIPDEINPMRYTEGALGMAHAGPDTGGSQWFVTLAPQPHLDGIHTVFGSVVRGMGVLRDIQPGDRIEHITIELYETASR
ncbi:MAG: peptidyl-prolyl cis-trans isomerase B (cyclophilin B) [Myxococcota bacterium]|jgi:peptidyl-prolyl cis-trans isomerase B (cyclophilin B)